MNLFSSSQAKKYFEELLDFILFVVILSLIVSLFARYFWIFNLFDQFWLYYLFASVFLVSLNILYKRFLQLLFSIICIVICLFSFYKSHHVKTDNEFQAKLKIYYHNLNSTNLSVQDVVMNILGSNADIVFLVEMSSTKTTFFREQLINYKYSYELPREDNFGFAIYSKFKINFQQMYEKHGVPVILKVDFENMKMNYYLIHVPPPIWKDAFEDQKDVLSLVAQEIRKNEKECYMLLGDFNMTPESSIFQDFYKILKPKYDSLKILNPGTWPAVFPKYMGLQIDHIFSNQIFEMQLGESAGSDHRSLLIRL